MNEYFLVTIFPEIFESFLKTSLVGKAIEKRVFSVTTINLRDFAHDNHSSVDDTPYGGGSGMVLRAEPIFEMLDASPKCHRALLTPKGRPFDQAAARRLAGLPSLMLFCGRYEGIDERARGAFDEEISIGDYILFGGEIAAMAVLEAVTRLLPGSVGNAMSTVEESFVSGALEYPQYTKPKVVRGMPVPEVLLSGDHGRIAKWRRGQALARTKKRRPDLFDKLDLDREDLALMESAENEPCDLRN